MAPLGRPAHARVALARCTSAWLVVASLLALSLSQPFHATRPLAAGEGGPVATASAVGEAGPSAHDADLCPVCRAAVQTRLVLRPPLALHLAPDGASVLLRAPSASPLRSAPELDGAHPRAPPSPLLDLC
jgi:hypothetical protein